MDQLELSIMRAAIKFRGYKQKDLAIRRGMAPAQLSFYLNGFAPMPAELRESLIKELNIADTIQRVRRDHEDPVSALA